MFPGIGTLINGLGVLGVGILARLFFKKDLKNFEENLLPLGLLVLALGVRESLKSPDFIFTLFAVIIGALIGNYLQIENQIKNRLIISLGNLVLRAHARKMRCR